MRQCTFQYVKPKLINPLLKHMPLEELLQDKVVGMAFSVDSHYFTTFLSSLKENMFVATFHNTTNLSVHSN